METLDLDAERRELMASRLHENVLRERHLKSGWHNAFQLNKVETPIDKIRNKNKHMNQGIQAFRNG